MTDDACQRADPYVIVDRIGLSVHVWRDLDDLLGSLSPAVKRNHARYARVLGLEIRVLRLFPWYRHPLLRYVASFWTGLVEDPGDLLRPRWGRITFGWLNDGFRPTVWHTVRQLTHGADDPYTGIYVDGAPASLAEAAERQARYAADR